MDMIIKNGKNIHGEKVEVAIENGLIQEVASEIKMEEQVKVIDLENNSFVSAGWIDDHVHCYEKMDLYYDTPDKIGVDKGVTTVIDAGSTGADNIAAFYDMAKVSKTNVRALLNISKTGIVAQNELEDLENVDISLINHSLKQFSEFIVGLKARMSQSVVGLNNYKPLKKIEHLRKEHPILPMMVHIGSAPPKLKDVFHYMRQGDILTHCFNGKENGVVNQKTEKIRTEAWEAYQKGIRFDIGHGTDSFNFNVAEFAFKEKLLSDSISTDIYHKNRDNGPVYDLATTMEKMHVIGYAWEEIIRQVTLVPAESFHLDRKGRLEKGMDADLTIFNMIEKEKTLVDSNGNRRLTSEQIVPTSVIIGGEFYDI